MLYIIAFLFCQLLTMPLQVGGNY